MADEKSMSSKDRPALVADETVTAGSGAFVVPDSHRAAVLEGLGQVERGELVSDDEMVKLWKRCGL